MNDLLNNLGYYLSDLFDFTIGKMLDFLFSFVGSLVDSCSQLVFSFLDGSYNSFVDRGKLLSSSLFSFSTLNFSLFSSNLIYFLFGLLLSVFLLKISIKLVISAFSVAVDLIRSVIDLISPT